MPTCTLGDADTLERELTRASSRDVNIDLSADNSSSEVLALGCVLDVDGADAAAALAAAVVPDGELGEGGLAGSHFGGEGAGGGREEGDEGGDSELHFGGWVW